MTDQAPHEKHIGADRPQNVRFLTSLAVAWKRLRPIIVATVRASEVREAAEIAIAAAYDEEPEQVAAALSNLDDGQIRELRTAALSLAALTTLGTPTDSTRLTAVPAAAALAACLEENDDLVASHLEDLEDAQLYAIKGAAAGLAVHAGRLRKDPDEQPEDDEHDEGVNWRGRAEQAERSLAAADRLTRTAEMRADELKTQRDEARTELDAMRFRAEAAEQALRTEQAEASLQVTRLTRERDKQRTLAEQAEADLAHTRAELQAANHHAHMAEERAEHYRRRSLDRITRAAETLRATRAEDAETRLAGEVERNGESAG